ncbi:hypothetical protein NKH18_27200 [Streptomyces sp. M10(2022)]
MPDAPAYATEQSRWCPAGSSTGRAAGGSWIRSPTRRPGRVRCRAAPALRRAVRRRAVDGHSRTARSTGARRHGAVRRRRRCHR